MKEDKENKKKGLNSRQRMEILLIIFGWHVVTITVNFIWELFEDGLI